MAHTKRTTNVIKQSILLSFVAMACVLPAAYSDEETVIEQRGVMGVKDANVFAPKYKERLNTYTEQIQMGLTRGWLNQEQADHFKSGLENLRKLDAEAAANNYAEPGLSNLDKEFTKFNMEFSSAGSKPAASAEQKSNEAAGANKAAPPAASKVSTKPAAKTTKITTKTKKTKTR